jgi:putative ABC transport system permease protein
MKIIYYIKLAFKQIKTSILQSLINILGLSIGFTVIALICLYVNHQNGVDKFHNNVERIYRLEDGFGGITPATYLPFVMESIPEIENGCRFGNMKVLIQFQPKDQIDINKGVYTNVLLADSGFCQIFNFPLIKGNVKDAFANSKSILISESQSKLIFGDNDPINKTITYDGEYELIVKSVFKDIAVNSSLKFDAIVPIDFYKIYYHKPDFLDVWYRWNYETFILLHKNTNVDKVKAGIDSLNVNRYITVYDVKPEESESDVTLTNYADIYISDNTMDRHLHGNKKQIIIFSIIALFVLIIACINYINISVSMASKRFMTFGINKLSGATRRNMIQLILIESILISFIAVVISVLLVEFTLPYFRKLLDLEMQVPYSLKLTLIVFIGVPIVLGIIAGIAPSGYISKLNIIQILKGEIVKGKSSAVFRKALIILQFSISVFLVTGTILVKKQLDFITDFDPGYTMEQVAYSPLNNMITEHFDAFKAKVEENTEISDITRCNSVLTDAGTVWTVNDGVDKSITVPDIVIDENFFDFFGIDVISGRGFTADDMKGKERLIVANESLAKWFGGLDTVFTKKVYDYEIVGVAKDIQTTSLHEQSTPATYSFYPKGTYYIYFKIKSKNYQNALKHISEVWNDFAPQFPFKYDFLKDDFEYLYKSEIQFGKVFMIFGLLSIFIACLGLFAMSSFIAVKRTKEIGIRKAHGASIGQIIKLLSKEFVWLVIIANLIAIPASWFYLNNWLNSFAYKTTLSVSIYLFAAVVSLLIAFGTIFYHTISIARKNPVESLRYE